MLDLSKFGIGLGENPDMTNPFVVAAKNRIEEACHLALAVVDADLKVLDLREWRKTPSPAGGFFDGGVVEVETAAQVAAWLISWHRPSVAFGRVRGILEAQKARLI